MQPDYLVDILNPNLVYLHISTAEAETIIYDVSGCSYIAVTPNPDETLNAWRNGEKVALEPIRREEL